MGFLEEIVHETQRTIASSEYGIGLPPSRARVPLSFRAAVERDRPRGALVVEYKRVSPGNRDPILPARSVSEFAELTAHAGVSALSCLATVPRFHGSPDDVAVLARSSPRPVLFKDFVIDERQLDVAARAGASAVLLIARLATEGYLSVPLSALAEGAHRRGLEVVLEFHARSELSHVAEVAADVYGVNTRNLDTLVIDRPTASQTVREALEGGLRPLLGLSGVEEVSDARRFWAEGVDGLLVGSAVARARDPAKFLATLHRSQAGEPA